MVRSIIKDYTSRLVEADSGATLLKPSSPSTGSTTLLADLAPYVPLRLDSTERQLLQVLEQTLNVSEYTDHVDIASSRRGGIKTRRILDGILEVCHIAVGLTTAANLTVSTPSGTSTPTPTSYASKEPSENAALFQTLFEIGRRNKVLNPSNMRTTYGKLMYILQDAQNPTVAKSLGFSLYKPLVLVGPYLEEQGISALLQDSRLECATQYIADRDSQGNKIDRASLEALVLGKQKVTEELVNAYATERLGADKILRVLESLADAIAYIESNVRPVQAMLGFLKDNFDPHSAIKGFSLALAGNSSRSLLLPSYSRYGTSAYSSGSNEGPTLSHSHSTQYLFVWQSLNLWAKVQRHMHRLWVCADDDLLSTTSTYHLYNTGQGLNRVQNCPRVRQIMQTLLSQTQQEAQAPWVGLSVIHLGDRDVPNALVFIDKYTQIPRFLSPIVQFIQGLSDLCADARIRDYVTDEFGSLDSLKLTVLADYFKHGFDGSGDDGGSCIDGRLTSSWNWTSRIAKKRYYHAFMLSGFQGFDGDFR